MKVRQVTEKVMVVDRVTEKRGKRILPQCSRKEITEITRKPLPRIVLMEPLVNAIGIDGAGQDAERVLVAIALVAEK